MHEIGHSLFGLADEYPYYANTIEPEPDRMFHPPEEPSEPNVTINTNRATLKWKRCSAQVCHCRRCRIRIAAVSTGAGPLPVGTVGLFEGAHSHRCRVFRPEFDCKMRAIGLPFCRVCRQAIAKKLTPLIPTT